MQRNWQIMACVLVTTLASISMTSAKTSSKAQPVSHSKQSRKPLPFVGMPPRGVISILPDGRTHVTYLYPTRKNSKGQHTHYVALVGDPNSGLGFYALPVEYRAGAWRYRLRQRRPPWLDPLQIAIATDATRYNSWIPADQGYRYGVFNPIDGVGTPFFAGYYGPLGDDDDNDDDDD